MNSILQSTYTTIKKMVDVIIIGCSEFVIIRTAN